MKKILFFFVIVVCAIPHTLLADQSFTFTILSYNIHGLPGLIARDDPRLRITFIIQKLRPYPIVLLQENFAYAALIKKMPHPAIFHGNTSRFGVFAFFLRPFCGDCGSGLTNLFNLPEGEVHAYQRHPFTECSGWIQKRSDCFDTKGFLWNQLRFPNDATLSLYNTHLDSGRAPSDRKARAAQLTRIGWHLAAYAKNDAVILAGDFNARPRELASFIHKQGLLLCGSDEKRDYILFRNGSDAHLVCIEGSRLRLNPPLSDHDPIVARFAIGLP